MELIFQLGNYNPAAKKNRFPVQSQTVVQHGSVTLTVNFLHPTGECCASFG